MIIIKKIIGLAGSLIVLTQLQAQTVQFSFSAAAHTVTGWINVAGDPSLAVLTASDGTTGIGISSVATTNWYQYANTNSSFDGGGVNTDGFFPGAVLINQWFQYNPGGTTFAVFNSAVPQLIINGLNPDSVYTLKMAGSNSLGFNTNPVRYTVAGAASNGSMDLNTTNNTANGVVFHNVSPDAAGNIRVYVNTVLAANTEVADISGIQIIRERIPGPTPTVSITSPANNAVLADGGNITINATASETGGTIAKVEFYADTTKLGEVLSSPYSFTWVHPNDGHYTVKAKAIDAAGGITTATIVVSVGSLTGFWSTIGNIGMNPDSNFVGNVDSVRLAFRTKNIERMSISPAGNIGIGTITPSAQLHTSGSVRLAGLTNDSTKTRLLVSDTSGNLYYRSITSLANRWLFANGTFYDSADNIAIGTSNPQGYKLAVNGSAIFTQVKVKPFGSWPDYVFKKGYALPDLVKLEHYITVHKHLPGITSELEVRRDGIDVGDQQAALLKKMEELTLYLIDENKKLKEQNIRLEQQQREIEELKKLIQKGK